MIPDIFRPSRRSAWVLGVLLAAFGAACPAQDAAPAATSIGPTGTGEAQVMHLGTVEVKGQMQIVRVLMAIKVALRQPFSTDKAHEKDVVCRINGDIGDRTRTYLTCATNKQFTHDRYETQQHIFDSENRIGATTGYPSVDAGNLLQNITVQNPNHMLKMPVDVAKLEALLDRMPNPSSDAPEAATAAPDASQPDQPGTPPG